MHWFYLNFDMGLCTGKGAAQSEVDAVEQFGFSATTCCGYLPQVTAYLCESSHGDDIKFWDFKSVVFEHWVNYFLSFSS